MEDYRKIAALMLDEYVGTLQEKGIALTYTPEACAYLAEKSIHGQSGARDLRNNIRRMVEDKLAMALVEQGGRRAISRCGPLRGRRGAAALLYVREVSRDAVWHPCFFLREEQHVFPLQRDFSEKIP